MAFDFNDRRKVILRGKCYEFMLLDLVLYMKDNNKEDSEDLKQFRKHIVDEFTNLTVQLKKLTEEETKARLNQLENERDKAIKAFEEYKKKLNEGT